MLTYEALQTEVDAGNLETLKEMYAKWPFFQSTVELIETVMAKVDVDIVKLYQKELVTPVHRSDTTQFTCVTSTKVHKHQH